MNTHKVVFGGGNTSTVGDARPKQENLSQVQEDKQRPRFMQKIEPTKEEAKNGWTTETLTKYYADREKAAAIRIWGDPAAKKHRILKVQNVKKFNPLRWGKKKR